MDSLCRETFALLRRRAGPVCIEVGPAKEEQCEEVSDHPRGYDGNHDPIHPAESRGDAIRKHASVEKEEAQFDAA